MLNVGIIGASGYAGEELIDILLGHPQVRITELSAKIEEPCLISEMFPKFKGRLDLVCNQPYLKRTIKNCDLVFLALPHTVSMEMVPYLLKAGKRVIDLSADYRLKEIKTYEKFYQTKHSDKKNLWYSVYGLPELNRAKIKGAKLIANPGCYPTCAILALAPLVALGLVDCDSIIIDAKSGVSGAGRKLSEGLMFVEANEDFRAYKVNIHQHMPEINQELSGLHGKPVKVTFVPHLLPLNRGILETIYVKKSAKNKKTGTDFGAVFKKFYHKEPFVRIRGQGDLPRIKDVAGTNFCDIAIQDSGDSLIIIAVIDNLIKGASGQAVQNMNIMCKFPEAMGLL